MAKLQQVNTTLQTMKHRGEKDERRTDDSSISLKARLKQVGTTIKRMTGQLKVEKQNHPIIKSQLPVGVAATESTVVFVSCASVLSIEAARTEIESLVMKSGYSFEMPDTYSRVLKEIVRMRDAATAQGISTRIATGFAPMESLPATLGIEPELCRTILQTFHDLGDVLWYEDLGIALFKNRVILDPLLLIDFIREIFNHKNTNPIMSHAHLKALPTWAALGDDKQMEAMKQVLQKFHLVYSYRDDRVMAWDSDLIVPVFWQTKTPASWKFGGDILWLTTTRSHAGEAVRVHWEYHFDYGLPYQLFDHVIVASVSPSCTFDAGPDWMLYKDEEVAACRIMVGRDRKSLHQTIEVEAVVATAATQDQVDDLWWTFEQLRSAFVKVLRENPGLRVSSFALDDKQTPTNLKSLVVASRLKPSSKKWLPPTKTWDWFKQLMNEQV